MALDLQALDLQLSQGSAERARSCGYNSWVSPGSCSGQSDAAKKAPRETQPLGRKKAGPAIYR